MKVVSVCSSDWANFAYNFSESLKSVGVDSYSYCLNPHPFGYPKQSQVVSIGDLSDLTSDADFVVLHHSCTEILPFINQSSLIHYAAGTKFRQEYKEVNNRLLPYVKATFIALPEFQNLTPNYHYVVGAIDTDYFNEPDFFRGCDGPVFGHYPSNPGVKGTNEIVQILAEKGVKYIHSTDRVSSEEQYKRMKQCDIYVELLADTQAGKPYGSFGMTALEAAAMGKIVITQNNNDNGLYNETYGFCGLNFAKDADKLRRQIDTFSNYSGDYLVGQMQVTKKWVVDNHSYKATGERVLKILNSL